MKDRAFCLPYKLATLLIPTRPRSKKATSTVCKPAVFTEGIESQGVVETAAVFTLAVLMLVPLMPSIESRCLGTS